MARNFRRYNPLTDGVEYLSERPANRGIERLKSPVAKSSKSAPVGQDRLRVSPAQIVANHHEISLQVALVIVSFTDVVDYRPKDRGNAEPPLLWKDDAQYIERVKALLEQTKTLQIALDKIQVRTQQEEKEEAAAAALPTALKLRDVLQKFLESFVSVLGKAGALLLISGVAGILHSLGVPLPGVAEIVAALK